MPSQAPLGLNLKARSCDARAPPLQLWQAGCTRSDATCARRAARWRDASRLRVMRTRCVPRSCLAAQQQALTQPALRRSPPRTLPRGATRMPPRRCCAPTSPQRRRWRLRCSRECTRAPAAASQPPSSSSACRLRRCRPPPRGAAASCRRSCCAETMPRHRSAARAPRAAARARRRLPSRSRRRLRPRGARMGRPAGERLRRRSRRLRRSSSAPAACVC